MNSIKSKYIFLFSEGNAQMRDLLGGKGANLAEMTRAGLPVPPGFTITTETCNEYNDNNNQFPDGLEEQIWEYLTKIEEKVGKKLGDPDNPLLFSCRSGAKFSMPGMMDTVLNLGLNDEVVKGLSTITNNERFVQDSYRRLLQMFGDVVRGISLKNFDELLEKKKSEKGAKFDTDLTASDLRELVEEYKEVYKAIQDKEFPQDPKQQIIESIEAVFKSWMNKRAIDYRNHEGIPHDLGTAVNVQTMVFGNMGNDCATGVMFTRSPATGERILYGEYLSNAQGEDVVAGIRTPKEIGVLSEEFPEQFKAIEDVAVKLEQHYREMQDIEFTIERGKLFVLQTRSGKRTGIAAGKIAHDMVKEELISKSTAIMRLTARDLENSLFPQIKWVDSSNKSFIKEDKIAYTVTLGSGLPAGPGASCGEIYFTANRAEEEAAKGKEVILVAHETTPEDFHGMVASNGILTEKGGMTSHAAIVSRQIGKTCIVGAEEVSGIKIIEKEGKTALVSTSGVEIYEGEFVTLDGFIGEVYEGELPIERPEDLPDEISEILRWADELAEIKVRANADKPDDANLAFRYGAIGIGLARTEHQFFEKDRLPIVQKMIMSETEQERRIYLSVLLNFQREDFIGLYRAARSKPVTIRLIDPPLHEFLPKQLELIEQISKLRLDMFRKAQKLDSIDDKNIKAYAEKLNILQKVTSLVEANPMLGLRGCRLGIVFPEIIEMQVRAIFEAAIRVTREGILTEPEVMVPLVGIRGEFDLSREVIDRYAKETMVNMGFKMNYKVGTMIEVPRAALTAENIASGKKGAEFFSFGTNDLTQMTLGFSRDDVGKFIPVYLEKGILSKDPFISVDQTGVGRLMEICTKEGRKARSDLKVGICGEQGGDPESIDFCYNIGLDYVSCSPFRIPIARLSAAQSTIKARGKI
ncbi:MAG: pyruvate, phosphate dikinase [Candidatus Hodarchaeales archaeon]|jgi:pyruvate,orthophosphate dikinase